MAHAVSQRTAGIGVRMALGKSFADILHRTSPTEPVVFLGVPLVLLGVAALACAIPALRAARIPPAQALREA